MSSFVYNAWWQILFVTYHFKAVFIFHLYWIPLEDATKEANNANKAYCSRGTQEKQQIMLLHISRNVKFTSSAAIHVPLFVFFFPRMGGNDPQSLTLYITSFPDTKYDIISEQTLSRKLKQCFMHSLCHTIHFKACRTVQQVDSADREALHPKNVK